MKTKKKFELSPKLVHKIRKHIYLIPDRSAYRGRTINKHLRLSSGLESKTKEESIPFKMPDKKPSPLSETYFDDFLDRNETGEKKSRKTAIALSLNILILSCLRIVYLFLMLTVGQL